MTGERILIVDDSIESRVWLIESVMRPAGYLADEAKDLEEARFQLRSVRPDLVVLDAQLDSVDGLDLLRECDPALPVVVTTIHRSLDQVLAALQAGARDVLVKPFEPERIAAAIARGLQTTRLAAERDQLRILADSRMREFVALSAIGKTVTSLLYTEEILSQVVSAAVDLTHADEGSLFLIDRDTGELYLRAQKNMDEAAMGNLRVKVGDSLLGRVIQAGQPLRLDSDEVMKVKTSFLVRSILNVPMFVAGRVIGVLSVDHRLSGRPFGEHDEHLLSTLADYAAIALENARLYWAVSDERSKLNTILRDAQDAVIVADPDLHVVLANNAARAAFGLTDESMGRVLTEVVDNPALADLFDQRKMRSYSWRAEIPLADGRTLQGQLSELAGVGYSAVMQDISRLKELDRIKSEFISIVSHDLRTPLTTIRGYIELLARAGPLNDMQHDFVQRIERSTMSIVDLIADLLDVSRIEAGLDWEMETVDLRRIVKESIESISSNARTGQHRLHVNLPEACVILGNARRLGQVVNNLVSNAIKYTPPGGRIDVALRSSEEFAMLEVRDDGIGISAEDQQRIFDKFYRVESDATLAIVGTGLGLSIVKSIVEKHKGRVWVESEVGVGSTFTVLLPMYVQ